MKNQIRLLFTAMFTASLAVLLAGCAGEEPQPTEGYVGIFVEAPGRGNAALTTNAVLPETGQQIALTKMAVVPTAGFAVLQVATVEDSVIPGQPILGFLARVDDGVPSKQIRQATVKAQGQRLVLMTARIVNANTGPKMEYTVIGTHPVNGEIRTGDVFFFADVPALNDTEREAKMHKITAEVNSTILYLKKQAEK